MIIFGVDPGVSGAICVLKEGKILEVYEMPTMIDGKKNKRQVNGAEVTNIFLKELHNEDKAKVVVEHVTAMPGQGVTSMFNFGQSFWRIERNMCSIKTTNLFCKTCKMEKIF